MSVPAEVLEIIRQDELERTHEYYQPASEGPFECERCVFYKGDDQCGHYVVAAKGRVKFQGKWYLGRNGQVEDAACCDFFKRNPDFREPIAKGYTQSEALANWRRWADTGERFTKDGKRDAGGLYARNILELAVSREAHEQRKLVDRRVVEVYGKLERVDPEKVVSGQHRLHVDRMLMYVMDPTTKPNDAMRGLDGKLPVVLKYQGEYSAVDGNHRIAAAAMRGEKIDVLVVNLEEVLPRVPAFDDLTDLVNKRALTHPGKIGRVESPYHVHAVADKHVEKFERAIKHAFKLGHAKLDADVMTDKAWAIRVADAARKAVVKELKRALPPLLAEVRDESARIAYAKLWSRPRVAKADRTFDEKHPRARKWIRDHTAELVDGIDETTRQEIADLVEEMFADETINIRDLKDAIGDAIGDDARAETIARTETMRAANAGQREAWSQAEDDGLIEEGQTRVWIVTDDDRLCQDCEDMDGEEAALGEDYDGDGGDGPPLHPDCRCTEGLN